MAVVALLIAMLLPGLDRVRESSRRVVCTSNLRQIGLGLVLYADSNRDHLPYSIFIDRTVEKGSNQDKYTPENMMTLRLSRVLSQRTQRTWDGLGLLYATEILPEPQIFYCPSHHGSYAFDELADGWLERRGELVGNYHYRGQGPTGVRLLTYVEPSRAAIGADGLRTVDDYNHRVGLNVLRADLSLLWVPDPLGRIGQYLEDYDSANDTFDKLWKQLDDPENEEILDFNS